MQNRIKYNFLHFHWILNLWACPCMALWSFEITCLDQCANINNVGHMIPATDYSSWIHWCGSDVAAARVWRSVFGLDPCVSCGQRGENTVLRSVSTGPHGANILQSISSLTEEIHWALFMLQGPPLFRNVRTAERRRETRTYLLLSMTI